MLQNDLNEFMNNWTHTTRNVFKYVRPLVPDEYIVIEHSGDLFVCLPDVSTYMLKPMDEEIIRKMLGSNELIYKCWYYDGLNVRDLKTGSCVCGSWILNDNKYLHNSDCPCYHDKSRAHWSDKY